MRILLQRCTTGSVAVENNTVGQISMGAVLFVGISENDTSTIVQKMAEKVVNLRIFSNAAGKFAHSLLDIGGQLLIVSQFTLYADLSKGRRPSFSQAAHPSKAETLFLEFIQATKNLGVARVETGIFGANMQVTLCNDGPVTIWLDTDSLY